MHVLELPERPGGAQRMGDETLPLKSVSIPPFYFWFRAQSRRVIRAS